ncbi:MAG: TonB family protein [Casimicrobiaceae bacterium]
MDFAQQQRNPGKHVIGITIVIVIHVLVIYALLTGLARKAVEAIKKPLTATIIEEVKLPPPPPPPPPPPKKIVEPPKAQPVIQPYVPPPDIPVPQPTAPPVISAPTAVVPTEPVVIAPPAPPPPPKATGIRKGLVPIEKVDPVYPKEAIRAGVAKGKVLARLSVDEKGIVTDVKIMEADPPGVFNKEVTRALLRWKFRPEGEKFVGDVELTFTLKDE